MELKEMKVKRKENEKKQNPCSRDVITSIQPCILEEGENIDIKKYIFFILYDY